MQALCGKLPVVRCVLILVGQKVSLHVSLLDLVSLIIPFSTCSQMVTFYFSLPYSKGYEIVIYFSSNDIFWKAIVTVIGHYIKQSYSVGGKLAWATLIL